MYVKYSGLLYSLKVTQIVTYLPKFLHLNCKQQLLSNLDSKDRIMSFILVKESRI